MNRVLICTIALLVFSMGGASIIGHYRTCQQRGLARQQIAAKLDPDGFEFRCGFGQSLPRRDALYLVYPQGVMVRYGVTDGAYSSVSYWFFPEHVQTTLSEVVTRLDCRPRP